MEEKKMTAHDKFLEDVNRYEIKEFCAVDGGHFYVRCTNDKGRTFLYRCFGGTIEEQFIADNYDKLMKSERFFVSMVKYLAKTDFLEHINSLVEWHDYQVYHLPGTEEPSRPFSLYDVWQLVLGEAPVNLNEYFEGKK